MAKKAEYPGLLFYFIFKDEVILLRCSRQINKLRVYLLSLCYSLYEV